MPSDLPSPLVPSDVDLRDFPYMPVDIVRLFGSEFHAWSDDSAWRAGFTLWLKSYHQVPAGSIADDDVVLARAAELGRDVKAWKKLRSQALRGWVKCDDGRLYHPVVAEKVLEGWLEKLNQRKSSAAGNAKRYSQPFDPAPFDVQIEDCRSRLVALNPQSRALQKRVPRPSQAPPESLPPGDDPGPSGNPEDIPSGSQENRTELKGIEEKAASANAAAASAPDARAAAAGMSDFEKKCREAVRGEPCAKGSFAPIIDWRSKDCPEKLILAGLEAGMRKGTERPFKSFASFDGWIRVEVENSGCPPCSVVDPAKVEEHRARLAAVMARKQVSA